jgi:hypothetical protein
MRRRFGDGLQQWKGLAPALGHVDGVDVGRHCIADRWGVILIRLIERQVQHSVGARRRLATRHFAQICIRETPSEQQRIREHGRPAQDERERLTGINW